MFRRPRIIAAIGALLSLSLMAAMPAQAQSFSLGIEAPGVTLEVRDGLFDFDANGTPDHEERGWGQPPRGGWGDRDRERPRPRCLSEREAIQQVNWNGFDNVEIWDYVGRNVVEMGGVRGGWLYAMRVDLCTGNVDRIERVRRVSGWQRGY